MTQYSPENEYWRSKEEAASIFRFDLEDKRSIFLHYVCIHLKDDPV
jgi:hypothetical protein